MAIVETIVETRPDPLLPVFFVPDRTTKEAEGKQCWEDFLKTIPGFSLTWGLSEEDSVNTVVFTYDDFEAMSVAKNAYTTLEIEAAMYYQANSIVTEYVLSGITQPFHRIITYNFPNEFDPSVYYGLISDTLIVKLDILSNSIIAIQQYNTPQEYMDRYIMDILHYNAATLGGATRTVSFVDGTYTPPAP